MNQKDLYQDDLDNIDYDASFGEEGNLSDMEMYILSTEVMADRVLELRQQQLDAAQIAKDVNVLRRTGYLANSSYYPEIFQMSLNRSLLPDIVKVYEKFNKANKNFLKKNGLTLEMGEDSYVVRTKDGSILVEYPNFSPDQLLRHNEITPDNQCDYDFFAGYLLSIENFKIIQLAQTILAASQAMEELSK